MSTPALVLSASPAVIFVQFIKHPAITNNTLLVSVPLRVLFFIQHHASDLMHQLLAFSGAFVFFPTITLAPKFVSYRCLHAAKIDFVYCVYRL